MDAAPRRHELLRSVRRRLVTHLRVHHARDGAGRPLLRHRRATDRRWAHCWSRQGMTTARAKTTSPTASADDRVSDLLARMTLDEKLAQLGSEWAFMLLDEHGHLKADASASLSEGIGQITRVAG